MKPDSTKLIVVAALFLIMGILLGGTLGFLLGAWGGTLNGYEQGINDTVNYYECVYDNTPTYQEVTETTMEKCAIQELNETYYGK